MASTPEVPATRAEGSQGTRAPRSTRVVADERHDRLKRRLSSSAPGRVPVASPARPFCSRWRIEIRACAGEGAGAGLPRGPAEISRQAPGQGRGQGRLLHGLQEELQGGEGLPAEALLPEDRGDLPSQFLDLGHAAELGVDRSQVERDESRIVGNLALEQLASY